MGSTLTATHFGALFDPKVRKLQPLLFFNIDFYDQLVGSAGYCRGVPVKQPLLWRRLGALHGVSVGTKKRFPVRVRQPKVAVK